MRYEIKLFLLIAMGLTMQAVYAEGGTCPDGYYPIGGQGTSGCAPMPYNNDSYGGNTPPPPARWADRYGSVVFGTDSTGSGILGKSKDQVSSKAAESAALQDCMAQGGHSCHVNGTYHNQCVAVVWGTKSVNSASAATIEQAIQLSADTCNKTDNHCKVYYTACSMAVRVQ
jgi:hypothetical protein